MPEDGVPQGVEPVAGARRDRQHRRPPDGIGGRDDAQGGLVVAGAAASPRGILIGLVDGENVGELEHALLDPLQIVAGAGLQQDEKDIDHVGDDGFRLPGTDGLDDDDIKARGFGEQHAFAGGTRDAAEHARRRRGADEGAGIARQPLHARLVAEDRAARALRGGVDRKYRHAMPRARQLRAQGLDERRLADAGRAGNTDAMCAAGCRQEPVEKRPCHRPVLGTATLDKRDRARQQRAIATAHTGFQAVEFGTFRISDLGHGRTLGTHARKGKMRRAAHPAGAACVRAASTRSRMPRRTGASCAPETA